MPTRLVETLQRFARGDATLGDLGEALRETETVTLVVAPAEARRFVQDLDAAVKEKGIGNVKVGDTETPRVAGATTPDGFVPRLFTDVATAREWATAGGLLEPGELMMTNECAPSTLLVESVNGRYGGWVIDEGAEHAVTLDAPSVRRLYALLALEDFARLPVLHLVGLGGRFTERLADGQVQALVFDSERTASIGIEKLAARVPGVAAEARPVHDVLTRLLAAGVSRLNVNVGFTTERFYLRDDLTRMLAVLGAADPALQSLPGGDVAAAAARASIPDDLVAWARRYPAQPMVPPPGRSDADAERVFGAFRARLAKETVSIFEYVRVFGHDVDLYVQPNPVPTQGLTWPQRFDNPIKKGTTTLSTFTREETMRAHVREQPPAHRAYLRLSGVEIMRWAWAAATSPDFVQVDGYSGTAGAFEIPIELALQFLYPLYRGVEQLESVPSVGLARVTALPGAHGLRPEVARALLTGWKHVLGAKARAGGAPSVVEHAGGRWLPAFTTDDQFFDYGRANRAFDGVPVRADAQPPFGRWLAAAREADGVVLDPGAPRPLLLDHATLLALDLWARDGRQPRAADLVKAAAALLGDGTLTPRAAARAVADWPVWYLALQQTPDGSVTGTRMRQVDAVPVFATEASCRAFVDAQVRDGLAKGEWRAIAVPHRWRVSVFHQAVFSHADGAWLEPAPDGSGGLHVSGAMLDAAVERLHEQLTPRVPGFVAAA
jgi:hypothetical protein